MKTKQNSPTNKKEGEVSYSERTSVTYQAKLTLKEKTGNVVLIAINDRTTIELPAHLSQEEKDLRVENYIKLHNSRRP